MNKVISAKNLLGISIYTLDRGILAEFVIDLVYSRERNEILAFIIGENPVSSLQILYYEDISAIGVNSLIISSSHIKKGLDELLEDEVMMLNGKKSLLDKLVLTEKGFEIGRIVDLHFDPKTGKVELLEIHAHNGWSTILNGQRYLKTSAIRKIGQKVVIIDGQFEDKKDDTTSIINRRIQSVNDYQQIVYSQIKREKEMGDW